MTVAELIAALSKMPPNETVYVEGDYGVHQCDGVIQDKDGMVMVEIG